MEIAVCIAQTEKPLYVRRNVGERVYGGFLVNIEWPLDEWL